MMTTVGTLRYPSFNDMEAELSDTTEQLLILGITGSTIISGLALLFTAIVTCMFMHRSSKNARALGATGMEFTPGWTVGVWFIPIINLFRPYSAMKEIQMASTNPSDGAWKSAEPLGLLAPWWACWLIGGIIERGVSRAELKGIDFGVGGLAVHWISGILLIASGFLLTQILGHILGLQNSAAKKTLR